MADPEPVAPSRPGLSPERIDLGNATFGLRNSLALWAASRPSARARRTTGTLPAQMHYENLPITEAVVRVLSEPKLAAWQREAGRKVEFAHGRYWINHRGFYRLTHFAARLKASEIRRPTLRCWAFHVILPEEDSSHSNARSPMHLFRLADYESALDEAKRKQIRRARAELVVVHITDPRTLHDQGWRVISDNMRRVGLPRKMTEAAYLAGMDTLVADKRRVLLGAMAGAELVGYLETFAVDDTAYHDKMFPADASRAINVSALLHVEAAQLYRRSGKVTHMCAGLPVTDGISEFKRRIGMPIVSVPAYFWTPRPMKTVLRLFKPAALYRATGELPTNSRGQG